MKHIYLYCECTVSKTGLTELPPVDNGKVQCLQRKASSLTLYEAWKVATKLTNLNVGRPLGDSHVLWFKFEMRFLLNRCRC